MTNRPTSDPKRMLPFTTIVGGQPPGPGGSGGGANSAGYCRPLLEAFQRPTDNPTALYKLWLTSNGVGALDKGG